MDQHSLQYILMVNGQQSQLHNPDVIVKFSKQMHRIIMRGSTTRKNFLIDTATPHGDVLITEDSAMKSVNTWVTLKVTEGIHHGLHEWSIYIENQGETSDGSGLMLGIVPQSFNKYDSFISQGGGWCLSRAGKFYGSWRRKDGNVPTLSYGTGDHVHFSLNYDNATMMVRVGNSYVIGEIHNLNGEVFPAISLHYRQQVVRFEYHVVCEKSTAKQLGWIQRRALPHAVAFIPLTYQQLQQMPFASYLYSEAMKERAVECVASSSEGDWDERQEGIQEGPFAYNSLEASGARLLTLINAFAAVRRCTRRIGRCQFLSPQISADHLRRRTIDSLRGVCGDNAPLPDVGMNFWARMLFNLFSSALQASNSNPIVLSLIKSLTDFFLSVPPFSLAESSRPDTSLILPSHSISCVTIPGFAGDLSRIFPGILQLGVSDICDCLETPKGENGKELSATQTALMELMLLISLQRGLVHEVLRVCSYLLRYPNQTVSSALMDWIWRYDQLLQPQIELPDLCKAWRACKDGESLISIGLNPKLSILSVAYGNRCLFVHTADGITKWVPTTSGVGSTFSINTHTNEPRQYNLGASSSSMAIVRTNVLLLSDLMRNGGVAFVVYTSVLAVHQIFHLDELGDRWPGERHALAQLVSAKGDRFLLVHSKFPKERPPVAMGVGPERLSTDPSGRRNNLSSAVLSAPDNLCAIKVHGFSFTGSFPTRLWSTALTGLRPSEFRLRTCLALMRSSYINLGPPELSLHTSGGHVTVELWVKFLDTEGGSTLYQHGDKSTGGEVFLESACVDGAFSIRGGYRHDTRGSSVVSAPLPPTANRFFLHIALVFDGRCGLYFNGEQVASIRQGPHVFLGSPRQRWTVGNGCICQLAGLRVWCTNRSARDIARDCRHYLSGDEPGLTVQLLFNERGGNVAFNYVKSSNARHGICVGNFIHTPCPDHPLCSHDSYAGLKRSKGVGASVNNGGAGEGAREPFRSPIHDWRDLSLARCSVMCGLLTIVYEIGEGNDCYAVKKGHVVNFFDPQTGFLYLEQFCIHSENPARCLIGCDPNGQVWELFEIEADTKPPTIQPFAPVLSSTQKTNLFVSMLRFKGEEEALTLSPGTCYPCISTDALPVQSSPETGDPWRGCTAGMKDVAEANAPAGPNCPGPHPQASAFTRASGEPDQCQRKLDGRTQLPLKPLNYFDLAAKLFELLRMHAEAETRASGLKLFSPLADDVGRVCVQEIQRTFQEHLRWIKGPGAPRTVAFSSNLSETVLYCTLLILLRMIRRVRGYGLHPSVLGLCVRRREIGSEFLSAVLGGTHTMLSSGGSPTSALNSPIAHSNPAREKQMLSSPAELDPQSLGDGATLLGILHDIIFEVGTRMHPHLGQLAEQIVFESMSIFMPDVRYRAGVLRYALAHTSLATELSSSWIAKQAFSSQITPHTTGAEHTSALAPLLDGIVYSFSSVCSVGALLYPESECKGADITHNLAQELRPVSHSALVEIIATQQSFMKLCVIRQRSLLSSFAGQPRCRNSESLGGNSTLGFPIGAPYLGEHQERNNMRGFVALQDAIGSLQLLLFSTRRINRNGFDLSLDKILSGEGGGVLLNPTTANYSRADDVGKSPVNDISFFYEAYQSFDEHDGAATMGEWVRDYYEIFFDFLIEVLKFSKEFLRTAVAAQRPDALREGCDIAQSSSTNNSLGSVLSGLRLCAPLAVLHSGLTAIPILMRRIDACWFLSRMRNLIPYCKDVCDEINSLVEEAFPEEKPSMQGAQNDAGGQTNEGSREPRQESELEALYKAVIFTTSWIATSMVFSSTVPSLPAAPKELHTNPTLLEECSPAVLPHGTCASSRPAQSASDFLPENLTNNRKCVGRSNVEVEEILRNPLLSGGIMDPSFSPPGNSGRLLVENQYCHRRKFLLDLFYCNESEWLALHRGIDAVAARVPDNIARLITCAAFTAIYLSNEPLPFTASQSKESAKALVARVIRGLTPVRNEILLRYARNQKSETLLSEHLHELQSRCHVLLSTICSLDVRLSDDILYLFPQDSALDTASTFPKQATQRWVWVRHRLRRSVIRHRADVFCNDALNLRCAIDLVSKVLRTCTVTATDLIDAYREREDLARIRLQGLTQLLQLMQSEPYCTENVFFLLSGGFGHQREPEYEESLGGYRYACICDLRAVEYDLLWHFMRYTEEHFRRSAEEAGRIAVLRPGNAKGEGNFRHDVLPPMLCAALKLVWQPRGFAFVCKYRVVEFIFRVYLSIFVTSSPANGPEGCLPVLREQDPAVPHHRKRVAQFEKKMKQAAFSPSSNRSTTNGRKDEFSSGRVDSRRGSSSSLEGTITRTPEEQARYMALDSIKHLAVQCAMVLQNKSTLDVERVTCSAFLTSLVQAILTEMQGCFSHLWRSTQEWEPFQHHQERGGGTQDRARHMPSVFSPELDLLVEQIDLFCNVLGTIIAAFAPSYKFKDGMLSDTVAAAAALFYQITLVEISVGIQKSLFADNSRFRACYGVEDAKDAPIEEDSWVPLTKLSAQIRLVGSLLTHIDPERANQSFNSDEILKVCSACIAKSTMKETREVGQSPAILSLLAFAARCLSIWGFNSLSTHSLLALRHVLAEPSWATELEVLAPLFAVDLKEHSSTLVELKTLERKISSNRRNLDVRELCSYRLLTWVFALGGWVPLVPCEGMRVYYAQEGSNSAFLEGYLVDTADGGDKVAIAPTDYPFAHMRDLTESCSRHPSVCSGRCDVAGKIAANSARGVIALEKEDHVKRDFLMHPSPFEPGGVSPYERIAQDYIAPAVSYFLSDLYDRNLLTCLNPTETAVLGGVVQIAWQCTREHAPLFDELLECGTFLLIRRFACTQRIPVPLPMHYLTHYAGYALHRLTHVLRLRPSRDGCVEGHVDTSNKHNEMLSDTKSFSHEAGQGIVHEHDVNSALSHTFPEIRAVLQAQQRIASLLSSPYLYCDATSPNPSSETAWAAYISATRPLSFQTSLSRIQRLYFLRDQASATEAPYQRSLLDPFPWTPSLGESAELSELQLRDHPMLHASRSEHAGVALSFSLPCLENQGRPCHAKVVIEPNQPSTPSFPLWTNAIAFETSVMLSDQLFHELGDCCTIPSSQFSPGCPPEDELLHTRRRAPNAFSILTVYTSVDFLRTRQKTSTCNRNEELERAPSSTAPVLQLYVDKGNLKCKLRVSSSHAGTIKRGGGRGPPPRNREQGTSVVECSLPLKSQHWNCFMHVAVIVDEHRLTLTRAGETASVSLALATAEVCSFIFRTEGVVRQLVLGNVLLPDRAFTKEAQSTSPNEDVALPSSETEVLIANQYRHVMVFITSLRMTNSTLFLKTAIKDIAEMVSRDHMLINLKDSSEGNTCLFQFREGTGDTVTSFCRLFKGKLLGLIRWSSCPFHVLPFVLPVPDKPFTISHQDEAFLFPHSEVDTFLKALDLDGVTLIAAQLMSSLITRLSQVTVKQAMMYSLSSSYRMHVLCGRRAERVLKRQRQEEGKLFDLTSSNYFDPFRLFDQTQLTQQLGDLFCFDDRDYLPASSAKLLGDFIGYVVRYFQFTNQFNQYGELIEETATAIPLMFSLHEEVFRMEMPLSTCDSVHESNRDATAYHTSAATQGDARSPLLMPLALVGGGKGRLRLLPTSANSKCEQVKIFRDRAQKDLRGKYPDLQGTWPDTEINLSPEQGMHWYYFSITSSSSLPQSVGTTQPSHARKKLCFLITISSLRGVVMEVLFASLAQEIKKSVTLSSASRASSSDAPTIERSLAFLLNASMVHYLANCGASSYTPKDHFICYRTHALNTLACLLDLWGTFPHLQPYDHVPLHVSLSHINLSCIEALQHRGPLLGLPFNPSNSIVTSLGTYHASAQALFTVMFNAIRLECLWTGRSFRQRVSGNWHRILKVWRSCVATAQEETMLNDTISELGRTEAPLKKARCLAPLNVSDMVESAKNPEPAKRLVQPTFFSSPARDEVEPARGTLDSALHRSDSFYSDHSIGMKILHPCSKSLGFTSNSVCCGALGNGEWRVRRSCGYAVAISSCAFLRGRFYFEVRPSEPGGAISVGLMSDRAQLNKTGADTVGAHVDSWGLDIARQCLLSEGYRTDLEEHLSWVAGDVLGVLIDLEQGELIYLYHGKRIANMKIRSKETLGLKASMDLGSKESYFPSVSVNSCMCFVNLGEAPFVENLPPGFLPVNPKLYCNPQVCLFWYAMIAVKWASKIIKARQSIAPGAQQTFIPDRAFQTVRNCVQRYCEGRDGALSVDILCSSPNVCVNRYLNEVYTENHTSGGCLMQADVAVHRGRWYYEVLMKGSNDLSVGWTVAETNRSRGGGVAGNTKTLGNDAQCWVIETERMVAKHNGRVIRLRHHSWHDGDVLGCLLDCDAGTMTFTANGRPMLEVHDIEGDGILFKNVICPKAGLSPIVKAHCMRGAISFRWNGRDLLYPPKACAGARPYRPIGAEDVITEAMQTYYLSEKEEPGVRYRQPFSLSSLEKLLAKFSKGADISLQNFCAHGLDRTLRFETSAFPASSSAFEPSSPARGGAVEGVTAAGNDLVTPGVEDHSVGSLLEIVKIFSSAAEALTTFAQEISIAQDVDGTSAYPLYMGPYKESLNGLRPFTLPYLAIRTVRHALQETCNTSTETVRLRLNRRKALVATQTPIADSASSVVSRLRDSLFGQIFYLLADKGAKFFCRNRNLWTVSFHGEGADDVGGPYRESLSQVCSELMSTKLPLFTPVSNGSSVSTEYSDDMFVIHPCLAPPVNTAMYRFIGRLMGGCLRGGELLSLYLPSFVWKFLVFDTVDMEDLAQIDPAMACALRHIENLARSCASSEETARAIDEKLSEMLCPGGFVITDAVGNEHEMIYDGRNIKVNRANADVFVQLALSFKLKELGGAQLFALREGFHQSAPLYAVSSLKWFELEALVCGQRDYDPDALLDAATYENVGRNDTRVIYLRQILREFNREQRALFARFVSGRERLPKGLRLKILPDRSNTRLLASHPQLVPLSSAPSTSSPPSPRSSPTVAQTQIARLESSVPRRSDSMPRATDSDVPLSMHRAQSRSLSSEQSLLPRTQAEMMANCVTQNDFFDDDRLPHASTCFYWLTLPRYSCVQIMREKLLYAIEQCTDIDADFRVYDNEVSAELDQPASTRVVLEPEDEFEDFSHLL